MSRCTNFFPLILGPVTLVGPGLERRRSPVGKGPEDPSPSQRTLTPGRTQSDHSGGSLPPGLHPGGDTVHEWVDGCGPDGTLLDHYRDAGVRCQTFTDTKYRERTTPSLTYDPDVIKSGITSLVKDGCSHHSRPGSTPRGSEGPVPSFTLIFTIFPGDGVLPCPGPPHTSSPTSALGPVPDRLRSSVGTPGRCRTPDARGRGTRGLLRRSVVLRRPSTPKGGVPPCSETRRWGTRGGTR